MGLIERIQASRTEQRVIGGVLVPWRPWDSPYWKFSQGGPVHPSRAYYGVDRALGLPALYACTRLLSESIASLPLKIYNRGNGGGPAVPYTGPSFFDQPSASMNLYDWLYSCMTSLVLHGNAWGMITSRDGYGYPQGVEWIPCEFVTVVDDEREPFNPYRTRVYLYGRQIDNWRTELLHIRAFALPGRTEGISPLRAFALTVMNGLEAERYGTDWFASGGFPPGTFQNTNLEVDADAANAVRESLVAALRRHEPLVYGRDWEYKPLVVPPSEAQFIEAIQMNATQMAAVYGLPPDRVGGTRGDSLTYNTVEQSTLQVIDALRPWMVRLETAFYPLIPNTRYVRFNADALLKTDLQTRTSIYNVQRNMGMRTIDEIRDLEDLPPLPGSAGNEWMPLEVMVAMSRSIRGIPKSMVSSLELEIDIAADRLQKLQAANPVPLAAPDTEPSAISPAAMLGRVISAQRDLSADDLIAIVAEAAAKVRARQERQKAAPEFVGPWIPSDAELATLATTANGNGNGRAH